MLIHKLIWDTFNVHNTCRVGIEEFHRIQSCPCFMGVEFHCIQRCPCFIEEFNCMQRCPYFVGVGIEEFQEVSLLGREGG